MPLEIVYRANDRDEKLGDPPAGGFKPDDPKVIAWEQAHGHDLRLKCLPEFGCVLSYIEVDELQDWARRLRAAIAALPDSPTMINDETMFPYLDRFGDAVEVALNVACELADRVLGGES